MYLFHHNNEQNTTFNERINPEKFYSLNAIINETKKVFDYDYNTRTDAGDKLHKKIRAKLTRELNRLIEHKADTHEDFIRIKNQRNKSYPGYLVLELFNSDIGNLSYYFEGIRNEAIGIGFNEDQEIFRLSHLAQEIISKQEIILDSINSIQESSEEYSTLNKEVRKIDVLIYAFLDAVSKYGIVLDEYKKTPVDILMSNEYKESYDYILNKIYDTN